MDEHILAAVIRLNKTIAFRGVEPLHRTHCHFSLSSVNAGAQLYRNRREERQCRPVSPARDVRLDGCSDVGLCLLYFLLVGPPARSIQPAFETRIPAPQ